MKKVLSAIIAAVMGAVAVVPMAACGSKDGRIKVTIGMWPDDTSPKDVAMFKKWEEAFEAAYPEYDIVPQPYTYSVSTVSSMALTGQLPTVFQTYFTEPGMLIEKGWIADVTDQLTELGWLEHMDEYMRQAVSKDGRCYGVPRDGYGLGLYLNLEMLHAAGVIPQDEETGKYLLHDPVTGEPTYPTTFEELHDVSEKVVEAIDGAYGMVILSADRNGGWQFTNMAWNFGCDQLQVPNGDGTYSANLNDPAAVKALEWIQQMKAEELIYPGASFSYADWHAKIGNENVAMAFCGSDALMLPTSMHGLDKEKMGFVPMPSVEGVEAKSLYGGTPYVFSAKAKPEEIKGALLFLKYMGRSPEADEITSEALRLGNQTAWEKNIPVVPTIKPWTNQDYVEMAQAFEDEFINIELDYVKDFFDSIDRMKKPEEKFECQHMYEKLDNALQDILAVGGEGKSASALLTTANSEFYNEFLKKIRE